MDPTGNDNSNFAEEIPNDWIYDHDSRQTVSWYNPFIQTADFGSMESQGVDHNSGNANLNCSNQIDSHDANGQYDWFVNQPYGTAQIPPQPQFVVSQPQYTAQQTLWSTLPTQFPFPQSQPQPQPQFMRQPAHFMTLQSPFAAQPPPLQHFPPIPYTYDSPATQQTVHSNDPMSGWKVQAHDIEDEDEEEMTLPAESSSGKRATVKKPVASTARKAPTRPRATPNRVKKSTKNSKEFKSMKLRHANTKHYKIGVLRDYISNVFGRPKDRDNEEEAEDPDADAFSAISQVAMAKLDEFGVDRSVQEAIAKAMEEFMGSHYDGTVDNALEKDKRVMKQREDED